MSYTTNRQPEGILVDKIAFLQEGMISEIVAINDYSTFIELTDNKQVRDIFYHIMEEEKLHYGMFLTALRKYDEEQEIKSKEENHVNISKKSIGKYTDLCTCRDKNKNILIYLRDAIKGELEAILLYESFIANLSDTDLIDLISKIASYEKGHLEELTLALTLLDKDSYGPIEKDSTY